MKPADVFRRKAPPKPLVSSSIPDIPFEALPPKIASTLRAAAARIRAIVCLRGVFAVIATAVIAVLCIMAVDAMVTISSHAVRWAFFVAALAAVGAAAHVSLIRPLSKKLTPARLAALIERNHPELQESLSTVVELMASPESLAEGSEALLKVVAEDASVDAGKISPRREFTARTVKPKFIAAAAALAILSLLFALWPRSVGRLILRAVAPTAEVDNLYADCLHVTPGDAVILANEPFTVDLAVVGGFPGQAYVRCRPVSGGRETSERMTQTSAERTDGENVRHYRFTVGSAAESFLYRVECGSALTRAYTVTAVPAPACESCEVEIAPPAYTRAGPVVLPEGALDIEALEGSVVTVRAKPNHRAEEAALVLSAGDLAPAGDEGGVLTWNFTLDSAAAGSWDVRLVDSHGFTNAPSAHRIVIVKDAAPEVSITSPTNTAFNLPPYARIPIEYEVRDDFGAAAPRLQASVDGGPWSDVRELPVEESSVKGVSFGACEFRVGEASRGPSAKVVRFRVAADDFLPEESGGPHQGRSSVLTVRIEDQAASLAAQGVQGAKAAADNRLGGARDALKKALDSARAAHTDANGGRDGDALGKLGAARESVVLAEDIVGTLAEEFANGMLDMLAPDARNLLDHVIAPAHEAADDAILSEPGKARIPAIRRLINALEDASEAIESFQKKVDEKSGELAEAAAVEDLADQQSELAVKDPSEMTPEELAEWEKKQEELAERLEEMAKLLSDDPLQDQEKKAEEIADGYDRLAEEQKKLEDIADRLAKNPDDAAANEELAQMTPDMPLDSSADERMFEAQDRLAADAQDLSDKIDSLANELSPFDQADDFFGDASRNAGESYEKAQEASDRAFDNLNNGDADNDLTDPMNQAADAMQKASESMKQAQEKISGLSSEIAEARRKAYEEALEAMQNASDPNWNERRQDQNGETPADPQMDPGGEMQNGEKQDGEPQDGESDPNGEPQDGQMDPNGEPQDGQMDPNGEPQDGQMDPNAAQNPRQQQAQQAADALQQLAQMMQRQAGQQPQSQQQGQQNQSQTPSDMPSDMPSDTAQKSRDDMPKPPPPSVQGVPDALRNLGVTDSDWLKVKNGGGAEALDGALQNVPPEYRDLVKSYFEALSKSR